MAPRVTLIRLLSLSLVEGSKEEEEDEENSLPSQGGPRKRRLASAARRTKNVVVVIVIIVVGPCENRAKVGDSQSNVKEVVVVEEVLLNGSRTAG